MESSSGVLRTLVIFATVNNTMYAYDEATGSQVWKRSFGRPPNASVFDDSVNGEI